LIEKVIQGIKFEDGKEVTTKPRKIRKAAA